MSQKRKHNSVTGQTGQSHGKKWMRFLTRGARRYLIIWIWMGILILAALTIVHYARAGRLSPPLQAQVDILPDRRAKAGTLSETEGRRLEEGEFWVVLNQIPTVEEGDRMCNIEYENPESNHYSARVSLYLKSTGELLGGTSRVDPGNYVENIELKKKLAVGEYPVTARVELFEKKEPAGGLSLDITLHVAESAGGGEA